MTEWKNGMVLNVFKFCLVHDLKRLKNANQSVVTFLVITGMFVNY